MEERNMTLIISRRSNLFLFSLNAGLRLNIMYQVLLCDYPLLTLEWTYGISRPLQCIAKAMRPTLL
jgi:hypothetical protein